MKCEYKTVGNTCSMSAIKCGRPTRANIFFSQYPNAPHRNGIPYAFPCLVDEMICDISRCKPNFDDNYCWLCAARYWTEKICDT
jgi:hypothetical protein